MPTLEPHRVFISYARADAEKLAGELQEALKDANISVWWDRQAMQSRGRTFLQEIRDAISECESLLAVVSPKALQSKYVESEWQHALLYCKRVVPILADGDMSKLPKSLANYHCVNFASRRTKSMAELIRLLREPPAPVAPLLQVLELPFHFVPQERLHAQISDYLLKDIQQPSTVQESDRLVGIYGLPGVGKSVAAAAVARSTVIRRAFEHGIIWIPVGSAATAQEVATLVRDRTGALRAGGRLPNGSEDVVESNLSVLLILDDVWDVSQFETIVNQLGPRGRILITTRNRALLARIGARTVEAAAFSREDSMQLLSNYSRTPVKELPVEANRIISVLGGLPLALAVSAAMVSEDIPWRDVLGAITRADLSTMETALPNYVHPGFHRAQQASLEMLEKKFPGSQSRYDELAVFDGGRGLDEEAVQMLWAETAGLDAEKSRLLLAALSQRVLLTLDSSTDPRKVRLHDMQWLYLRWRLPDTHEIQRSLLAGYEKRKGETWLERVGDGYLDRNIGIHLVAAGRDAALVELLLDPRWIERRLTRGDLSGLLTDYTRVQSDILVKRIGETLRLSAHVLVDRPEQLATQLIARLEGDNAELIRSFLSDTRKRLPPPGLIPRFSSLTRAGTGLVSIMRHRAFYGASTVAGDKQGTIWIVGTTNGSASAFDCRTGNLLWESPPSEDPVTDVSFNDDKGTVAILSGDGSARILTLEDGKEVRCYPRVGKAWDACSLSGNGLFSVQGRRSGLLERVDLRTGAVKSLPSIKKLLKVAISESGSQVAVAHAINKISVFEAETGIRRDTTAPSMRTQFVVRLMGGDGQSTSGEGQPVPIDAVAVSDSGPRVACALAQNVFILNPLEDVIDSTLIGHNHPVTQVRFLQNDALVATASRDRTIRIWKTSSGDGVGFLSGQGGDPGVIGMGANRTRIGASCAGTVRIWDVDQLTADVLVRAHHHGVSHVAISGDGKKAVTGSWDKTLILWDLEAIAVVQQMIGHTDEVVRVSINEDGTKIVSGAVNGEVILWDVATRKGQMVYKHDDEVTAVRIAPSGDRLVSVSMDHSILSMDLTSRQGFHSAAHFTYVNDVALTSDGRTALTVSDDDRILRWDLLEQEVAGEIDLDDPAQHVRIAPDDKFAIAATHHRLYVVGLPGMRVRHKAEKQESSIKSIALAPKGDFAVTGHENGEILVIDLTTHSEIKLPPHAKAVNALGVTGDGKRVVSASEDGTVRVTTIKGCAITAEFVGDSGIHSMALSPTSDTIVAGEKSGNVHILVLP
jgi:WD40 repeat protein